MKKIQNSAALFFIVCAGILGVISVLGVWDVLSDDVITKSFQTISLLAVVSVIVIYAGKFIDARNTSQQVAGVDAAGNPTMLTVEEPVNPIFTSLRHLTIAILIVAVALLALLGIMSIWDVLSGEVFNKALSSIAIIAFDAFIIVLTCLDRENHKLLHGKNKPMSGGAVFLVALVFFWMLIYFAF